MPAGPPLPDASPCFGGRSVRRRGGLVALAFTLGLAAPGAAKPPALPTRPEAAIREPAAEERVAALVEAIRSEQALLVDWVRTPGEPAWRSPELRRSAERLAALRRELRALGGEPALRDVPILR